MHHGKCPLPNLTHSMGIWSHVLPYQQAHQEGPEPQRPGGAGALQTFPHLFVLFPGMIMGN